MIQGIYIYIYTCIVHFNFALSTISIIIIYTTISIVISIIVTIMILITILITKLITSIMINTVTDFLFLWKLKEWGKKVSLDKPNNWLLGD